ncbi:MAG: hypothetical protein JWM68_2679, partial [Verrucomicrobiales bacterium]|nr:hypothetical protein [Verrucomicrobiales bacterium]
ISKLILDTKLAVDFRVEMLQLVRRGQLHACLDAAIKVVESSNESDELKTYAVLAIGECAHSKSHAELFNVLSGMIRIPNRLCSTVIQSLYPKSISSAQVAELLAKTEAVEEFSIDLPIYLKSHFSETLEAANATDLLRRLIVLAQSPPLISDPDGQLPVSAQFYWIGQVIPAVLEKLLNKASLSTQEIEVMARALQLLSHIHKCHTFHKDQGGELNQLTFRHFEVRRENLWLATSEFRAKEKKEPTMWLHVFDYGAVVQLSKEDFPWLLKEVCTRDLLVDRIFALRLAIEAWDASGRSFRRRWQLHLVTRTDPTLRAAFRQSPFTGPLFPIKRFWWQRIRYQYGRWWFVEKCNSMKNRWHWYRGQFRLLRNIRLIESGKHLGWLERLSREAEENNSGHWAPSTWDDLEKKRGKRITRATKDGCIAAWRKFKPHLPHEKPKPNETSIGIIIGLTGLRVEFEEDPASMSRLSNEESELAARYAMDELNEFPSWIQTLAGIHPQPVGRVLLECVEAEWQFPADRQYRHDVMANLAWRGAGLSHLVADRLLSLIRKSDPANDMILRFTISILIHQSNPPLSHLSDLAAKRLSVAGDIGSMALWLSVWIQIDCEAAIIRLEALLAQTSNPDELVARVCSILSGEEQASGLFLKDPSYLRPACLRRFIPLIYRHVRYADDLDRSKGAYTPIARDHAQRFRSVLLNKLENEEDHTATDVLRQLADDSDMAHVRDWILNILDKRLVKEADSIPWTPADVREFAETYEVDPKNDKELFAIARKRLQVLKWDVELSDNSSRDELRKEDREMLLRRWLQRRLMERSEKRYTIPQEEEIDQQQRPDLRLENPRTNPVSIEIKWADSWTLAELLERLENQLIGQYLRAHNSSYGIYFLGFIGKKQHWEEPNTGKRLTAVEIIATIRQRAISLMQSNPKVLGLEVVTIDFRQPTDAKPKS